MELLTYLRILNRRKWMILLTTLITVIVALAGTSLTQPTYRSNVTLRVASAGGGGSLQYVDYLYADRLLRTYTRVATSGSVVDEVARRLDLNRRPKVAAEPVPDTELIEIMVEDHDPNVAADFANNLAATLIAQSRQLYTGGGKSARDILGEQLAQTESELAQDRRDYSALLAQPPDDAEKITAARRSIELKEQTRATLLDQYEKARVAEAIRANAISIVEPARVPVEPSSPRRDLNIGLGALVGLIGGIALAFLFENMDTRLYNSQDVEEVTQLSTLGWIPEAKRQKQFIFYNGNSPQGEAFRQLRTNIFAQGHGAGLRSLLVTSAEPKEGKSSIVANLAYTIAQTGRKVVVVDGDLRMPTLHRIFDLPNRKGLSNVLKPELTLDQALQDSKVPGVKVLASGPTPSNPPELLDSPQMLDLIQELNRRFDVVLIDGPALLSVTDASILASVVDGVVLVVGAGVARVETVRSAQQQLSNVRAKLMGVVVNRAPVGSRFLYERRARLSDVG